MKQSLILIKKKKFLPPNTNFRIFFQRLTTSISNFVFKPKKWKIYFTHSFFFLWSFSSIFPTICDEFYKSKNMNVFYSIFSFKWDPWWSTFVSQFLIYRIPVLGLQDSFIGLTWFVHWVYRIPSLSLHDSFRVFTGFLNRVYMIPSECLHDS